MRDIQNLNEGKDIQNLNKGFFLGVVENFFFDSWFTNSNTKIYFCSILYNSACSWKINIRTNFCYRSLGLS